MTLASIYERVHTSLLQVCGNVDGARIHAQNAIRKKSEQLNYLRLSSRLDAVASRLDTQAKMNHHGYGGARLDATGALTRQPAPTKSFSESRETRRNLTRRQLPGDAAAVSGPLRDFLSVKRKRKRRKHIMVGKNMANIVKTLDRALKAQNLEQIATTMDSFEKQFENLDVRTEFMETAMSNTTSMSTPEDQVNLLMQEVAEEHQLDLAATLSNEAAVPGGAVAAAAQPAAAQPVVEPADDLSGRLAPGGAATLSAYARDTRTPAVRHGAAVPRGCLPM